MSDNDDLAAKIKASWIEHSNEDTSWDYCDEHSVDGDADRFAELAARVAREHFEGQGEKAS